MKPDKGSTEEGSFKGNQPQILTQEHFIFSLPFSAGEWKVFHWMPSLKCNSGKCWACRVMLVLIILLLLFWDWTRAECNPLGRTAKYKLSSFLLHALARYYWYARKGGVNGIGFPSSLSLGWYNYDRTVSPSSLRFAVRVISPCSQLHAMKRIKTTNTRDWTKLRHEWLNGRRY